MQRIETIRIQNNEKMKFAYKVTYMGKAILQMTCPTHQRVDWLTLPHVGKMVFATLTWRSPSFVKAMRLENGLTWSSTLPMIPYFSSHKMRKLHMTFYFSSHYLFYLQVLFTAPYLPHRIYHNIIFQPMHVLIGPSKHLWRRKHWCLCNCSRLKTLITQGHIDRY
jgi:hypothetical protein